VTKIGPNKRERISAVKFGNAVDSVAGFIWVSGLVFVVIKTYMLYLVRDFNSPNNQRYTVFLLEIFNSIILAKS